MKPALKSPAGKLFIDRISTCNILTTMVDNILHELLSLGLSEYEARVYITLVSSEIPATAYEIAKKSQISTSKIYEVMGRLIDRKIVQPIDANGANTYVALDPDEFIAQYRSRMETSLDRLAEGLSSIRNGSHVSTIWNLDKYDRLIEKSIRMIDSAEKHLLVSVWHEEMKALYPALSSAEKRKVQIGIIHFGEPVFSAGAMFPHPIADTIYDEKGGRGIAMVSDAASALIGTIHENGHVEGGWSESKGFIILTEDYIKHDIYIMKIVSRYDGELIRRFGENYHMLRDVYSDMEL